jgi:tRNA pseudouridine38-40 synthase
MRYKLLVEYDGTAYHGWQLQPHGRTVQGVLEEALATLLRTPTRIQAAGRTDAGVHALGQVAIFDCAGPRDPRETRKALNALTPRDVAIREVTAVADDFDPRRHAASRVYEYRIWNQPWPSAFYHRLTWWVPRALDIRAMRLAAAALAGEHDFSAFRAADCEAESPVRRVLHSGVTEAENLIVYRIQATAFLKHMVRAIAGTLVEIGGRGLPPGAMAEILASRDRGRAGATAPARGLTLMAVEYRAP